jgi:lipopolysaccharide/colanic/teichoic acid biosynthesis glycosyltransferase
MKSEQIVKLPQWGGPTGGVDDQRVVGFPLRPKETAGRFRESRLPVYVDQAVPDKVAETMPGARTGLEDVLSGQQFQAQLRREKRRSERSNAPLSIATFRVESADRDGIDNADRLLHLLSNSKRETDILGCLDHDLVAIILPETGGQGLQHFIQKVADQVRDVCAAIGSATYPDELFEALAAGRPNARELEPLFLDRAPGAVGRRNLFKRCVDVTGAMTAILVFSPVMLVTALAIATTSRGPIIYRQVRLGQRGSPFVFYKFRSMHCSVDDTIHRAHVTKLIEGEPSGGGAASPSNAWAKIQDDPRVTRIGRFIRKTKIDELPQLVNVLKGDLSLVGPRPPLPYEVEKYRSWHLRRILDTKPGITGLWQVEGGGQTTFEDMVRLDLRYIHRCSFMLDIRILLKTFTVVVRRGSAG